MKSALMLGTLSAINIAVTFLFQRHIITVIGPGIEADALFAGMTIPQIVLAVISGSLMHVLVPLLAGEDEHKLRDDAWGFFTLIGGAFALFSLALGLTAPLWVPLTVPGFDAHGQALTVSLTRIQLLGTVFSAVNGVQWAAYHARQRFLWAELTPTLAGVFAFALLVWALPRYGIASAAWIATLRLGVQTLFLSPGMGRPVWPDLASPTLRKAWGRIKPLLVGTAYYKTDPLADRYLLSSATSGSLSLFYLAQQIYGASGQVINRAIAAPLVPALSRLYKLGDFTGYQRLYLRKLGQSLGLTLAGLIVLLLFGRTMLDLVVGYGAMTKDRVSDLWWLMVSLSGVFVGGAGGQICASSFYAKGDTVTSTRMSMITYTIYIPAKIVAYAYFGMVGLALVTSGYYILNLSLQMLLLRERPSS